MPERRQLARSISSARPPETAPGPATTDSLVRRARIFRLSSSCWSVSEGLSKVSVFRADWKFPRCDSSVKCQPNRIFHFIGSRLIDVRPVKITDQATTLLLNCFRSDWIPGCSRVGGFCAGRRGRRKHAGRCPIPEPARCQGRAGRVVPGRYGNHHAGKELFGCDRVFLVECGRCRTQAIGSRRLLRDRYADGRKSGDRHFGDRRSRCGSCFPGKMPGWNECQVCQAVTSLCWSTSPLGPLLWPDWLHSTLKHRTPDNDVLKFLRSDRIRTILENR